MNAQQLEQTVWRCVDGEMTDAQQRAFLADLDQAADGWRQLALVLLEDRVWKDACREPSSAQALQTQPQPTLVRRPSRRPIIGNFVLVAGMLIAVGLAFAAGRRSTLPVDPRASLIAEQSTPAVGSEGTNPLVSTSSAPEGDAAGADQLPPPRLNLEFVSRQGQSEVIPVPIYPRQEWDRLSSASREPLPQFVRDALTRSGYRVDEGQQLLTVPLNRGRHLALPVNTLRVRQNGL